MSQTGKTTVFELGDPADALLPGLSVSEGTRTCEPGRGGAWFTDTWEACDVFVRLITTSEASSPVVVPRSLLHAGVGMAA